jgi:hypothetical protein
MIEKAIQAIVQFDTVQLYNLIDTANCFSIYSKDGFLNKIDYASNRFKTCSSHLDSNKIRFESEAPYHYKYVLPFCRDNDSVVYDSFDLIFNFAEYKNDRLIDFMDIVIYRSIKTTIPHS